MIEFLTGKIIYSSTTGIILDVNGVGYGLDIPFLSLQKIKKDASTGPVALWIHTRVREDLIKLFGFSSRDEKDMFELLISINGVGPRVALAVLSSLKLDQLIVCIESKDIDTLLLVPGIGKKTAEKMLVELYNKWDSLQKKSNFMTGKHSLTLFSKGLGAEQHDNLMDVRSALDALGFKEKEIASAVSHLRNETDEVDTSVLVRKALTFLSQKTTPQTLQKASKLESLF